MSESQYNNSTEEKVMSKKFHCHQPEPQRAQTASPASENPQDAQGRMVSVQITDVVQPPTMEAYVQILRFPSRRRSKPSCRSWRVPQPPEITAAGVQIKGEVLQPPEITAGVQPIKGVFQPPEITLLPVRKSRGALGSTDPWDAFTTGIELQPRCMATPCSTGTCSPVEWALRSPTWCRPPTHSLHTPPRPPTARRSRSTR